MIHLRGMAIAFHLTPGEGKQMSFNWSERVVPLLGMKQNRFQ